MFNKPEPIGPMTPPPNPVPPSFPEMTTYTVKQADGHSVKWDAHHVSIESCGALHLVRGLLLSAMQPMPYPVKIYAPGEWKTIEGDHDYEGWKPESPLAI